MKHRLATLEDAPVLAALNHQLIQDEGHRNPMSEAELADRMRSWLSNEYRAVIFETTEIAAYALDREYPDHIYLRQFFVPRHLRRAGIGRQCIQILFEQIWPAKRVTVDVLSANPAGVSFWRSVGFSDYCLTLEALPGHSPEA
jgi:GNAT superfamily N-acetyltransferase